MTAPTCRDAAEQGGDMPSQRGGVPRVAVGVGSSAATHAAVRMAAREAALRGYELRLVYGLHRVPEELPDGASFPAAETLLDHATAAARAVAPQLTISTVIHEGTQTAALLRESRFAELLVLDADGLDTSAGWSLDIPAMRLASRADCTVLLARDEGRDEWPVLVGVDPSTGGERALEFAFDAGRCGTATWSSSESARTTRQTRTAWSRRNSRKPSSPGRRSTRTYGCVARCATGSPRRC